MKQIHWILFWFILFGLLQACVPSPDRGSSHDSGADQVTRIEQIGKKLEADPGNAKLYNERARLLLVDRELNGALGDINQAIQLDDRNAVYFITLSDIYLAMDKIANSLEALQKVEELDPENNEGLLKQAEIYLVLRDYDKTFQYVKKALVLDDINPVAYFIRGYALMETGDTAYAVRDFMIATGQDQTYYEAFMQLGYLYSLKNDRLAVGYFENAINSQPNDPEGYYMLGMFYQQNEEFDNAIRNYENLLTIYPDYTDAYYNLGYINLVYLKDFPLAIRYFSDAIDRNTKYVDAWFNRGYSYELSRNYTEARKDYKKCLQLDPTYDRAIEGLNRLDRVVGK